MNTDSKYFDQYYAHVNEGKRAEGGLGKVFDIINDISDRRGIGDQWDQIDDDIQDEIVDKWLSIIEPERNAMREYTRELDPTHDEDTYTVEQWNIAVQQRMFCTFDGSGYWVKDGKVSKDEVFSTPPLDATHVTWFNK